MTPQEKREAARQARIAQNRKDAQFVVKMLMSGKRYGIKTEDTK